MSESVVNQTLKRMQISKCHIYIDDVKLEQYVKRYNYHTLKGLRVYTISNVCFCGVSGKLTVYFNGGVFHSLSFLVLNIRKMCTVDETFFAYYKFLCKMKETYRQQSENHFYNKHFHFNITKNENNYMMVVKGRHYDKSNEI